MEALELMAIKINTVALVIITFFALFFYFYLTTFFKNKSSPSSPVPPNSRIVLITAHPDDECMFFSPTLASLLWSKNQCRASVYVICVTTGDYYKKGNVRRKELLDSCQVLGILKENVEILDNSSFPDDPKASWNLDVLSDVLQGILNKIQANIIFTFDERGVSGHPNHIAVSNVVKQLFSHQTSCQVYQLESVSLVRKYIGLLDLPLTVSSNKLTFVSSPRNIIRAQQAMLTHKSQLEWFRILYILFSRYMFMNTYHSCK